MSSRELSIQLGFSRSPILRFIKLQNLKVPKDLVSTWRVQGLIGKTSSTPAIDKIITENYLTVNVKALARMVDKSSKFIYTRLSQLGLVIPAEIVHQRKLDTWKKKGDVPMNKGRKQHEYMTPDQIARASAGCFRKGNVPPNTKHDGAIVIRHSKPQSGSRPYQMIRISKSKWKMLHVVIWEEVNGPVPEGSIIIFTDGNTMNTKLSNLKCITRAQHIANTRESDQFIAMTMSKVKGAGRVGYSKTIYEKIIQNKDLLDLKRKSLQLKKAINEHTN